MTAVTLYMTSDTSKVARLIEIVKMWYWWQSYCLFKLLVRKCRKILLVTTIFLENTFTSFSPCVYFKNKCPVTFCFNGLKSSWFLNWGPLIQNCFCELYCCQIGILKLCAESLFVKKVRLWPSKKFCFIFFNYSTSKIMKNAFSFI